jgi:hypothetical protein
MAAGFGEDFVAADGFRIRQMGREGWRSFDCTAPAGSGSPPRTSC